MNRNSGTGVRPLSARSAPGTPERQQLEWLAQFSTRHAEELRRLESAEAKAPDDRELLEWLAVISDEHRQKLDPVLREDAEERRAIERRERTLNPFAAQEVWDASKHPRLGGPPNAGWWASAGDSGASSHSGSAGGPARTSAAHEPRPPYSAQLESTRSKDATVSRWTRVRATIAIRRTADGDQIPFIWDTATVKF